MRKRHHPNSPQPPATPEGASTPTAAFDLEAFLLDLNAAHAAAVPQTIDQPATTNRYPIPLTNTAIFNQNTTNQQEAINQATPEPYTNTNRLIFTPLSLFGSDSIDNVPSPLPLVLPSSPTDNNNEDLDSSPEDWAEAEAALRDAPELDSLAEVVSNQENIPPARSSQRRPYNTPAKRPRTQ